MTTIMIRVLAWCLVVSATVGLTAAAADLFAALNPDWPIQSSARSFVVGVVTGIVAMVAAAALRPARRPRSQTVQTWRIR